MLYFDIFLAVVVLAHLLDHFMLIVRRAPWTAALPLASYWTFLLEAAGVAYLGGKYLPMFVAGL